MNVTVDEQVTKWMQAQAPNVKKMFNTKCQEAIKNDLSTWRDVGKGIHDFRASGDFRVVATKKGNDFKVLAIYRHATSGGKTKVKGQTVAGY